MSRNPDEVAILNCTVLSNLSIVQRPDMAHLLLLEYAVTTEQVMAELREGIRLGRIPACDWSWLPVLELSLAEQDIYRDLAQSLGDGEASCLAVAMSRGAIVLTDDKDARKEAGRLGISVSGTLGVLKACVERGILNLSEADRLLQAMVDGGYRSPVKSIRKVP
jgi:predicted nucleic acid-binding protein